MTSYHVHRLIHLTTKMTVNTEMNDWLKCRQERIAEYLAPNGASLSHFVLSRFRDHCRRGERKIEELQLRMTITGHYFLGITGQLYTCTQSLWQTAQAHASQVKFQSWEGGWAEVLPLPEESLLVDSCYGKENQSSLRVWSLFVQLCSVDSPIPKIMWAT